jgi:hypothetical protein
LGFNGHDGDGSVAAPTAMAISATTVSVPTAAMAVSAAAAITALAAAATRLAPATRATVGVLSPFAAHFVLARPADTPFLVRVVVLAQHGILGGCPWIVMCGEDRCRHQDGEHQANCESHLFAFRIIDMRSSRRRCYPRKVN